MRFVGSLPRDEVLDALAGAEAAVLSSDWENFPHAAVEALAVGTPLVATAVGGVGEIVVDGVNGLLVPPGSPEAFGHALQRLLESPELRARLSDGARASVAELGADQHLRTDRAAAAGGESAVTDASADGAAPADPDGRPDAIQPAAARSGWPGSSTRSSASSTSASSRPRTRQQLASATTGSACSSRAGSQVLDGVLFYLRLPFHVRRQIIEFRPEAIIAESPYTAAPALVGRALARGQSPRS